MRTLAGLLLLLSTPLLAAEVTQYTALFQNKPAGKQVTRVVDGSVTVDLSYRNNGRGPDISERYELARDRTLLRYEGKGKSEF